jgi:hypothetical protein
MSEKSVLFDRDVQMAFKMKFLDGSPVDDEYAARVAVLIRDAADAEVSEQEEATVLAAYRRRWAVAPPCASPTASKA